MNDSLNGCQSRRRPKRVERCDRFPYGSPKNTAEEIIFSAVFFYPNRRFGISSRFSVYLISPLGWISSLVRVYLSCGLMIYNATHWWYTATSCGFHTWLRHDLDAKGAAYGKEFSSVFANISEAQYPQSLADMLSKFEIARKECMETESWLKLKFSSKSIDIEKRLKQGWKTLLL